MATGTRPGRARPLSLAGAIAEGARLTDRDHQMIVLLAEHRALTSDQLGAIFFPSMIRARQRLRLLTERGVLARFRRYQPLGSPPWIYTLGLAGAAVHAAQTGQSLPTPAEITTRIVRLSHSPSLGHLLGANEFFAQLHAAARRMPGAALTQWWSESVAAHECGGIVRPDGYGQWTEHPAPAESGKPASGEPVVFEFFYEHDTGTETILTLIGKLDRYEQLAAGEIIRTVLVQVPDLDREHNLHEAIRHRYGNAGPRGVPVATTYTLAPVRRHIAEHATVQHGSVSVRHSLPSRASRDATSPPVSPTGPLWWLFGGQRRYRLAALAAPTSEHTTGPTIGVRRRRPNPPY